MKITRINISNVLGVSDAELIMGNSPLALICGDNAVGKSSFREAVSLALCGVADRAPAKKDWQKLVTDGAQTGTVIVETADRGVCKLKLPSGTGTSPLSAVDDIGKYIISLCFGNRSFSRETDKARRAFAGKVFAGQDAHTAIAAKLIERGQPQSMVDQITPLLRMGTDEAKADCDRRATEAKGAWRSITGETWGKAKAPEWTPEGEPGKAPKRSAADAERDAIRIRADISAIDRKIGAAQSSDLSAEEKSRLRVLAAEFAKREASRVDAKTDMDEMTVRVHEHEALVIAMNGGNPLHCPHCDGRVTMKDGKLEPLQQYTSEQRTEASKTLLSLREQLKNARLRYNEAGALADESDRAAKRLRSAESTPAVDTAELEQSRADAQAKLEAIEAEIAATKAHHQWISRRDDALTEHKTVLAWLALAEQLADPTIGAEAGSNPVEQFNHALKLVSDAIGWPETIIGETGEMTFGGRLIQFASESDRWKADATVAIAMARADADIAMVMLDRCDVLSPQSRPALFRFLAQASGLSTALAFATLKAPPSMPESVAVLWLGQTEKVPA